jgi:hypothetical protein
MLTNKREEAGSNPLPSSVFIFFCLHLAGDYRDIYIIIIIISIIIIIIIIITIPSAFSSSLVLVTVFPQRGIEQGEHVCAIIFNARNL